MERDEYCLWIVAERLTIDDARAALNNAVPDLDRYFGGSRLKVISLVVSGMLNKQIADQLGTAENTVKVHRSRAMEKMHAQSLAGLAKMIEKLKNSSQ